MSEELMSCMYKPRMANKAGCAEGILVLVQKAEDLVDNLLRKVGDRHGSRMAVARRLVEQSYFEQPESTVLGWVSRGLDWGCL